MIYNTYSISFESSRIAQQLLFLVEQNSSPCKIITLKRVDPARYQVKITHNSLLADVFASFKKQSSLILQELLIGIAGVHIVEVDRKISFGTLGVHIYLIDR